MSPLTICGEGNSQQGDLTISAAFLKLDRSYLLLVTDQADYGIGTVTLSSPPTSPHLGATSAPFSLFGLKNNMLANLIGKSASKHLHAPVLSLILIKATQLKPEMIIRTTMDAVLQAIEVVKATPEFKNG
ncbi:MAG: hypothetical protein KAR20_07180 [Candidatus Heimdallarchaeota archaeon]|nr:hypothetical protein [Candidatus Heimdallarchaeota archaeon]